MKHYCKVSFELQTSAVRSQGWSTDYTRRKVQYNLNWDSCMRTSQRFTSHSSVILPNNCPLRESDENSINHVYGTVDAIKHVASSMSALWLKWSCNPAVKSLELNDSYTLLNLLRHASQQGLSTRCGPERSRAQSSYLTMSSCCAKLNRKGYNSIQADFTGQNPWCELLGFINYEKETRMSTV